MGESRLELTWQWSSGFAQACHLVAFAVVFVSLPLGFVVVVLPVSLPGLVPIFGLLGILAILFYLVISAPLVLILLITSWAWHAFPPARLILPLIGIPTGILAGFIAQPMQMISSSESPGPLLLAWSTWPDS